MSTVCVSTDGGHIVVTGDESGCIHVYMRSTLASLAVHASTVTATRLHTHRITAQLLCVSTSLDCTVVIAHIDHAALTVYPCLYISILYAMQMHVLMCVSTSTHDPSCLVLLPHKRESTHNNEARRQLSTYLPHHQIVVCGANMEIL